jgi:hypothetical protein
MIGDARHGTWHLEIVLSCLAYAASTDFKLSIAKSKQWCGGSDSTQTAYCPDDSSVAVAGFSDSDAVRLKDVGSAPAWGTSRNQSCCEIWAMDRPIRQAAGNPGVQWIWRAGGSHRVRSLR